MSEPPILVAKLRWSDFYQGEPAEPQFSEGDEYFERFNFRLCDGTFYGVIPKGPPVKALKGEWLLVFVARGKEDPGHYAVGWYENASFEDNPKENPKHPADKDRKLEYTVSTRCAYLLPPVIRKHFKVHPELMKHFERATHIYARGPGAEDDKEWRKEFIKFAERVQTGTIII